LNWQKEILKFLSLSKPVPYPLKQSIFERCKECGDKFEINPGEQKYFEKMNFEFPRRCQSCRDEELKMYIDEDLEDE